MSIVENRKASHDYFIEERFEAGVALQGWEAKAIRAGRVQLAEAYVVLRNGEDTRMRFLGAPTGYEFVPLVEAVLLAGTGKVDLEPESEQKLAAVTTPTNIKVFSTPT